MLPESPQLVGDVIDAGGDKKTYTGTQPVTGANGSNKKPGDPDIDGQTKHRDQQKSPGLSDWQMAIVDNFCHG